MKRMTPEDASGSITGQSEQSRDLESLPITDRSRFVQLLMTILDSILEEHPEFDYKIIDDEDVKNNGERIVGLDFEFASENTRKALWIIIEKQLEICKYDFSDYKLLMARVIDYYKSERVGMIARLSF